MVQRQTQYYGRRETVTEEEQPSAWQSLPVVLPQTLLGQGLGALAAAALVPVTVRLDVYGAA